MMKKYIQILITAICFFIISCGGKNDTPPVIPPTPLPALPLLWSDEFNATDSLPTAANWGYDVGGNGWGNNELQYYTSRTKNAYVSNGLLNIVAQKENFNGSTYTSARLISKNKFSFKYGTVEIRAKIPAGVGTLSSLWMLGNNVDSVTWPICGQIGIMGHVGNKLNNISATLQYPGRSATNADGNYKAIETATTDFHLYRMDWTTTEIKFYIDGYLYHSVNNTSALPFNQKFFFILSTAIGGNFGGTVDPALTSAIMQIDYIRIYQ
jgi:beta-glucanase (GH16 family)